ncbi:MAG: Uma2 family endonuclease [Planctomycetota bacterium]
MGEHNVFQPDLLVLPEGVRVGPADREVPLPHLVVEVLSPSTARRDRREKREEYLAGGVEEVWLVDPEEKSVTRWDRAGCRTVRKDESIASSALPGFALVPRVVFGG